MLIVGLGNPGERFEKTRHNAGFMFVDAWAEPLGGVQWKEQFQGLIGTVHHESFGEVLLLKPQTCMNNSGLSVASCVRFFKIPVKEILVVHDELDLSVGKFKLKEGGSHRGHNGVRSIHQHLGNDQYRRLLFGIDRPVGATSVADHVLSSFSHKDLSLLQEGFQEAIKQLPQWLKKGV